MSPARFLSKVTHHQPLNQTGYYSLILELLKPSKIEFTAGQYVLVSIPGHDRKRQYSIASAPSTTHQLQLLIDARPQGPASRYFESLKLGDQVEFLGPAGVFTVEPASFENKLVFIASGSGISPLKSMIHDQLQTQQTKRSITLFWSLRYESDLFWQDDWDLLSRTFPNFSYHISLTQPSANWPLGHGRMPLILSQKLNHFDSTGFYLCGNPFMIESTLNFLQSHGVIRQNIHTEKFY